MDFEIIPETEAFTRRKDLIYAWPDEVFDGQQRLITPVQVKELGYASPGAAGNGFRSAAQRRNMRAMIIMVKPGRKYPNGGVAVRALPEKNPAVKPGTENWLRRCREMTHDGENPLPRSEFHADKQTRDGIAYRCKACIRKRRERREQQEQQELREQWQQEQAAPAAAG